MPRPNRAYRKTAHRTATPSRSEAVIRVPAPPARPWELKQDEVTLVKNQICKGATDEELQLCLTVARRYKLDPFRGQIWFVKRRDSSVQGGYRWVPIVGIDGLQHIAARDHRDYGSVDEPEYGPMHEVTWSYGGRENQRSGKFMAPEWARVRAWKKGADKPTTATVYWNEIYPDVGASPTVRQMPRLMLGKCARAQAIRQSYPATDGLYIREEFQGPPQYTENGRAIVYPDAVEGAPLLDENAAHGHAPGSEKAKQAEATLAKVEEEDRKLKEERAKKSAGAPDKPRGPEPPAKQDVSEKEAAPHPKFSIEIDLTNPEDPIVRGDVDHILPPLEKHIVKTWKDDWWHIRPVDVGTLYAAGKELGFKVTEFPANPGKGAAVKGEAARAQTNAAASKSNERGAKSTATQTGGVSPAAESAVLVKGTIERVISGMTGKNNPLRQVTILLPDKKKPTYGCFDSKLFPHLDKAIGKEAEVFVQERGKYLNLIGIKRIAGTEFEDNLPVIQKDREPGTKTFWS